MFGNLLRSTPPGSVAPSEADFFDSFRCKCLKMFRIVFQETVDVINTDRSQNLDVKTNVFCRGALKSLFLHILL